MTSRERVRTAINHRQPDRVPLDLGSTLVTGIQVSAYARLKTALGITGGLNRVYDPFQMLGQVEPAVREALGVDTVGIELPTTIFGYPNENWKSFRMFDGTDVEISGHCAFDVLPNGDIVQYPKGDRTAPPSGRMPKGGFYFDTIVRQEPIDESKLSPKEWVEQTYSLYTEEELRFLEESSKHWYESSTYSLVGNFWGGGFGDIVQYPKGDRSARPSGRMPQGGYYFDSIVRQEPIDESKLDAAEWVAQTYSLYTEEELRFIEETSKFWYEGSEYGLLGNFWGAGFGDIATVPGPAVLDPKGIRDPEEWYVSTLTRKDYVKEIFRLQLELQMKNLERYRQAVGDRIDVVVMSGTDFGSQNGPFLSPAAYREIFKPLHKTMNDWVHAHTSWKTFYHTCGSIVAFLDDFAEAGIDILNPVQISAAGMAPDFLKGSYGETFVFWGGAIDAQHTLAFGSPQQVREEAERNLTVLGKGGGFIFNNVHNIQATVPTENMVALFETVRDKGGYSKG